jgi:hypothetical protein
MNTYQKNKSAVHLGKKSAEARKKKLGAKGYREYMKTISRLRFKQEDIITKHEQARI